MRRTPTTPIKWTRALGVTALLTIAVGCSSSSDTAQTAGTETPANEPPATDDVQLLPPTSGEITSEEDAPSGEEEDAANEGSVDVCSILTDAEVNAYLMGTSQGQSMSDNGCEWYNPDTEETVTLTVGQPGTAASGVLEEPSIYGETESTPEVGGVARFAPSLRIVEFIAGDRLCELQAAILDDGRGAAIALATLVYERL